MFRRGHTLMEMLVVATLLIAVAALVGPRLVERLGRSRLEAGLRALRGDLEYTRARAIATGMRHQLMVDPTTGEIVAEPLRPEESLEPGAAQQNLVPGLALRDRLPQDIAVTAWRLTPFGVTGNVRSEEQQGPVTFYPEGMSDSLEVVLEETRGDRERRGLFLNGLTGEIRELTEEQMRALGVL